VLAFSVALAACAAISPARGILVFSFLFPCAGLLARTCGGADPVMWPGVLLAGLTAGWCFRFLYDFESRPQPSRADRALRALLAVWTLSTLVAAARAVTLWAAARRLAGRAVNGEGLPDAVALRESLFAFAALAGGVAFYFLLRRAGEGARRGALSASLAGAGISAAAAILQRAGALPDEAKTYWKLTGRLGGGAVDPNSLGLLCALLLLVALAGALRTGGRRIGAAALGILLSAGLFLSGSRSGFLLVTVSLVVLPFATALSPRARVAAAAALLLLAAAAAALALRAGGGSAGARLAETFDPALPFEYRASARPLLWRAAGRLFLRHPVEGGGMGAFTWQFPDLLREEGRALPTRDNPGSGYVQALAETGILGFLVTIAAAISLASQAWRRARRPSEDPRAAAAGISVIAFLASLLSGSHWLAPDVALLFFLLAAVSADPSGPAGAERPAAGLRSRLWTAAVLVYGAAALVAIAATGSPEETFRFSPRIGFHDREVGAGGPFRWTRRRFALWLRPGETVRLGLANFGAGRPVAIAARVAGRPIYRRTLAPGQVTALLLRGAGRPAAIVFDLDRAFVPRRLGVSGDRRTLGLLSTSTADPAPGR
jgi:O-antigen ligase